MKKDLLFGLKGSHAVLIGMILYIFSRIISSAIPDKDIVLMTLLAMLELSGLWFFFVGLYRWNKEMKAKKLKKLESAELK